MITKENERLARYTTFRIGGTAPVLYVPESEAELMALVAELRVASQPFYLLGNGSNLLVYDGVLSRPVIHNAVACASLRVHDDGRVEVGSSVDVRRLIAELMRRDLASPVDLSTIPATIGGAIFQNASRATRKVAISDNLETVRFFDGEQVRTIARDECAFGWRTSIFQRRRDWIILGATFRFGHRPRAESRRLRQESLDAAAGRSYRTHLSAGSVFKTKTLRILKWFRGLRIGGAEYSPTTLNTIHNLGNARFRDVRLLIGLGIAAHRLLLRDVEVEVETWR